MVTACKSVASAKLFSFDGMFMPSKKHNLLIYYRAKFGISCETLTCILVDSFVVSVSNISLRVQRMLVMG